MQTWIALGKPVATCNFAASPFFALHDLYSGQFLTVLAGGCPKVVVLTQLPFAVNVGPNGLTSWKNTCGTLPVQLQQWRPCEWQD